MPSTLPIIYIYSYHIVSETESASPCRRNRQETNPTLVGPDRICHFYDESICIPSYTYRHRHNPFEILWYK